MTAPGVLHHEHGILATDRPVNRANPIARGMTLWQHAGVRAYPGVLNLSGWPDLTRGHYDWSAHWQGSVWSGGARGKPGLPGAAVASAGDGGFTMGQSAVESYFPSATDATILAVYRKRDTTARSSYLCGMTDTGGGPNRREVHLPFSDGTIYWDWGGDTEGSTRVSLAGHTFDTDWHWWAFTVGGGLGMRVYKDGKLLASNAATPTASLAGGPYKLLAGQFAGSDNADLAEFLTFGRALREAEVVEWMRQSKLGHPDTLNWFNPKKWLFLANAAAAASQQVSYANDTTADYWMVLDTPWEFETDTSNAGSEFVDEDLILETETELLAYVGGSLTAEPEASFPLEFETVTVAGQQAFFSGPQSVSYANFTAVATTASVVDIAEYETVTGARVRVQLRPDGRTDLLDDRRYRR